MVDRPNKPQALVTTPGLPPQAQVNITHDNSRVNAVLPSGESIEVLLHGATVTSWKDRAGNERLWLSDAAKLDGSKAVRGGIPPGLPSPDHEPTSKLPQHGFARNSRWDFLGKSTTESSGQTDASVKLDFGLSTATINDEAKKLWPFSFSLIYSVTLTPDALRTGIVITNDGDQPFEFQTLLHTYFRIGDITKVSVSGLEEAAYVDKVDGAKEKQQAGDVTIAGEVDRVYHPANPSTPVVISEGGESKFSIVRETLSDVVVWNPWIEKAQGMGDFEPKDGYKNMICVEAGSVKGFTKLEAGDAYSGEQVITV
ncbi:aldose-1-epimerase [Apiospora arundinis]